MQLVSFHNGTLTPIPLPHLRASPDRSITTNLKPLDALLPNSTFPSAAIHEILSHDAHANYFAALLARSAAKTGVIIWSDPLGELYPPALADLSIPLHKLFLLRLSNPQDQISAAADCLRSKGVAATILSPQKLSRVEARRLQLSAEQGGGIGILLRPASAISAHYAAATRWLVSPARGTESVQRWNVQLIHGHGGQVGKSVLLEVCRDSNTLRATEILADRPAAATPSRATA